MNKLFVYGIFLGERMRQAYGMTNPRYDTVKDYVTYGDHVVQAHHQPERGLALSGLVVDVEPYQLNELGQLHHVWSALDRLERGYDRIEIVTVTGEQAYMYV